jgi:hypothetical protein
LLVDGDRDLEGQHLIPIGRHHLPQSSGVRPRDESQTLVGAGRPPRLLRRPTPSCCRVEVIDDQPARRRTGPADSRVVEEGESVSPDDLPRIVSSCWRPASRPRRRGRESRPVLRRRWRRANLTYRQLRLSAGQPPASTRHRRPRSTSTSCLANSRGVQWRRRPSAHERAQARALEDHELPRPTDDRVARGFHPRSTRPATG